MAVIMSMQTGAGLDFFYGMPLRETLEIAAEWAEIRKQRKGKGWPQRTGLPMR